MILGIGIDSVEIARFERWKSFTHEQLGRIFSPDEIAYCFAQPNKTAERFAVRFAVREALYKALSAAAPEQKVPFLTLCTKLRVDSGKRAPKLLIEGDYFRKLGIPELRQVHLSLTHTATTATALVVLEATSTCCSCKTSTKRRRID